MPLTADQRKAIYRAAKRWIGTPYDDLHGLSWKESCTVPRALDCSGFVCRVAMEALGYAPSYLAGDAAWLIDNLIEVSSPELGDLVGYGRAATPAERGLGYDRVFHVMLYAGNGQVIGACDLKRAVAIRSIDYKPIDESRRWRFVGIPPAPFRQLQLR